MNTLLITGTIKPLVQIKHCDPRVRCGEYMRNLERYICETKFERIIFAENSGYPADYAGLYAKAVDAGKDFRVLDVSENADSGTMSTGEARILQQTLALCPFLKDEDIVWKVSGRVFIRNANQVLHRAEKCGKNLFLYAPRYDSLQTWFCRVKVGDLKKFFLTEEAVAMMHHGCIEYAWMDVWKANREQIMMGRFPVYPDAEGINSSGSPYTLPKYKLFAKNLLLRVGYFTPKADKTLDRIGL